MVAFRLFLVMTLITGVIYPLAVTGLSQIFFNHQANGSLIKVDNRVIGSELVAQNFQNPQYFWPRPSAIGFNPLPSGGSNLALTSAALKTLVEERQKSLGEKAPSDLVFASASGLDPHISPQSAWFQLERVVKARNWNSQQIQSAKILLVKMTEKRDWGIFGEPRVNVLKLNIAIDNLH